jgi:hypothetical protein
MKYIFFTFSLLIFSSLSASLDSLSLNNAQSNRIFYSLQNGTVANVNDDNWHIAFSSRPAQFPSNTLQSASLRVNGSKGVKVYQAPNITFGSFANLDTTNWRSWRKLNDSDTLLWMGAFNRNLDLQNPYHYGWGEYTFTNHSVEGDSIHLLQLPNGDFKKITIIRNQRDTAFIVRYANLDNSNTQDLMIRKRPYRDKNFAYLNLNTNVIHDLEPNRTNWDFTFSAYLNENGDKRIGFLFNDGILSTEGNSNNSSCNTSSVFLKKMNIIDPVGEETFFDNIDSSKTYCINSRGNIYTLKIIGVDSLLNKVYIDSKLNQALSINDNEALKNDFSIYPNPSNDFIIVNFHSSFPSLINITDLSGRVVKSIQNDTKEVKLNVSDLPKGSYFLSAQSEKSLFKKLIVISK